ncbi:MAG: succinyl-diaminopimelate desuccinylase [Acidimicrobiales bacterium]|nr:succinyl-diaminopimelate desuccinylase [Acidimicrobiales bacterium]
MTGTGADVDLLALTAELVDVASVSRHEQAITAWLEQRLRSVPWLRVERVGDNLVARTELGRPLRLILAGHTDTVAPDGNERARVEGDRLWGLGASDMKGGLAVMLAAAEAVSDPAVDVTYVFYAREEIAAVENGLRELAETRPDLLVGDAALLGEPTGGAIEAGCQGTMRLRVVLRGARAHTARPWMGRNAIHRLAGLVDVLASYEERRPVVQGCAFREALQAVSVSGGVGGNVVPDEVEIVLNHRFAPDRSAAQAEAHVRDLLAPFLEPGDVVEVVDLADGAWPGLDHPLLRTLVERHGLRVTAKLGWTDVARFAALGIPATNLGPGDATVAHTAGEHLDRAPLEAVYAAVVDLLRHGPHDGPAGGDGPGRP